MATLLKKKKKAMPEEEVTTTTTEETPAVGPDEMGADGDVPAGADTEKYGAQVVRAVHADHLYLIQRYDEFLQHCEDPKVKKQLEKLLNKIDGELSDWENLWVSHEEYKELPPIEGMMEPTTSEDELEEGKESKDVEEPEEMDSGLEVEDDEEEPTPEEAVEGMKETGGKKSKTVWRKKAGLGIEEGHEPGMEAEAGSEMEIKAALSYYRKAKGMCPECGKDPCVCDKKKSLKAKHKCTCGAKEIPDEAVRAVDVTDPSSNPQLAKLGKEPMQQFGTKKVAIADQDPADSISNPSSNPQAAKVGKEPMQQFGKKGAKGAMGAMAGEAVGAAAGGPVGAAVGGPIGSMAEDKLSEKQMDEIPEKLRPHHFKPLEEASKHLKDLSEAEDLNDDMRMGSYHHAKALEGMVTDLGPNWKSQFVGDPQYWKEEEKEGDHKAFPNLEKDPASEGEQDVMKVKETKDLSDEEEKFPEEMMGAGTAKDLMNASSFLKDMAVMPGYAFGSNHRDKALFYHKAIEGLRRAEERSDVQHPDSNSQANPTGEAGDIGDVHGKDDEEMDDEVKALHEAFASQEKSAQTLDRQLKELLARIGG